MTIKFEALMPAHIQAGLVPEAKDEQNFEIIVRAIPETGIVLFSSLELQEGRERVFVGVVGVVTAKDETDLHSLSEDELVEVVKAADIAHLLYDNAAMIARQIAATLMYEVSIPVETIPTVITAELRGDTIDD